MRYILSRLLLVLLAGSGGSAIALADTAGGHDGPGAAGQPTRIVSQTVGTDEMLLAVAAPGQIAALSHLATDPEFSAIAKEAAAYPHLTPTGDAETVLKFSPTLVLFADYSRADLVAQVRRAGVPVIVFDHYDTLEETYDNLRRLGRAIGPEASARADAVIADCQARVAALEKRLRGAKRVRVIAPSTYGVIAGSGTTFQDLCDHAGAENLASTLAHLHGHEAPPVEQMLTWPVDRVVAAGSNLDSALAPYRELPPYKFMPAIREGRAVLVEPWQLGCTGQRRVDAYERLAHELHPDLVEATAP